MEKWKSEQLRQDQYWFEDKSSRRHPCHPVVKATFEPLADIVASLVHTPCNSSVLDVGCGNGYLQAALEQQFETVTGLDYSAQMLEVNPCENKIQGSSTKLPFDDNSFDLVVAAHLLHHLLVPDREKTLLEMKRVARTGIVSFEPNRNNPLMFLFALCKPEERMALKFCSSYMKGLLKSVGMGDASVYVQGWIVPNKAPISWIPIGKAIDQTPFRHFGVDICSIHQFS